MMFRFKQFTIHQDRTAMKVCTDACVLGAYADVGVGGRVLDIGTGAGLLALMAAQRNPMAKVDAVEVDNAAFEQATENVANSPFNGRVRVWHGRVQDFLPLPSPPAPLPGGGGIYHRILTNPPFYTNHLRSPDVAVNRALHTDELPFDDLITAVVRLLNPDGQWWVLLPPYETGLLTDLAKATGLSPLCQLYLRHSVHKPPFRVVTGFAFGETNGVNDLLTIYEPDNRTYTPEFRALLCDFYLLF